MLAPLQPPAPHCRDSTPCTVSFSAHVCRCPHHRNPCSGSSAAHARRGLHHHNPCSCSSPALARRHPHHHTPCTCGKTAHAGSGHLVWPSAGGPCCWVHVCWVGPARFARSAFHVRCISSACFACSTFHFTVLQIDATYSPFQKPKVTKNLSTLRQVLQPMQPVQTSSAAATLQ